MFTIQSEHFTKALYAVLAETFVKVDGYFLDKGNSLFETLSTITAEEASIPVGGKCATLAAQVKHTAFYLDVVVESVRNPDAPAADWGEIWRTVSAVTPEEWQAIQAELLQSYQRILDLIAEMPSWPSDAEIAGAISVIAHSAYHLGEIRQAMCILK